MKASYTTYALLLSVMMVGSSYAGDAVGTRDMKVPSPERGRDLNVTIWYPAQPGGKPSLIGENPAFKGFVASVDAPASTGSHPLVVLSHGSGNRAKGMGWLAVKLAEAGFIVAGPDHPGTTSGDSTPTDTPKLWQRTEDLSNVISALTADPQWSALIDKKNIGVIGFSLGGAAAMKIVGARASLEAYAAYCDTYDKWDCAWYRGGTGYVDDQKIDVDKVDLRKVDRALFEQSELDPRITSAVMIDPGLAQAYDPESLKQIKIPLSFINLGAASEIPPAVDAAKLKELTPHATLAYVAGANHYSFLPECKPGAAEMLKDVGEVDPICDETTRPRGEIHAEVAGLVIEALQLSARQNGQ